MTHESCDLTLIGPNRRQGSTPKRRDDQNGKYRTLGRYWVWSDLTLGPDGLPERVGVTGIPPTEILLRPKGRF